MKKDKVINRAKARGLVADPAVLEQKLYKAADLDFRIKPVASRYQKRSRPRTRWGSGVWRDPIDRWTS